MSYSGGMSRATIGAPHSNGPRNISPKVMDESNATDYSIFVGYGAKAKRVKDRWEATKKLLRFENNFVALKWLLDSFVDEYLRSKQMKDTVAMTAEPQPRKDQRRVEEASALAATYGRRTAVRSPPKTRFEEVSNESKPAMTTPTLMEQRTVITANEHRPKPGNNENPRTSGEKRYVQHPGHYSYKYLPEYWPPYYQHWSGGSMPAVNQRLVNVSGSVPGGYPGGYMVKTSSCSSLPSRESQLSHQLEGRDHIKRWGSATAVPDGKDEAAKEAAKRAAAVKLGFNRNLTKSMPNLQFISKEGEVMSEDEDEVESDPELSQGDLVALSSSSLSMPNLHRIPGGRPPLLSPPAGHQRYAPLLRDRHDVCPSSSCSMPNLQAIHGARAEDRKKTIREFVVNGLTRNDDEGDDMKTKIFNPNGYFMPTRGGHEPDNKRVKQDIRRRLLQRIEAKKHIQESHGGSKNAHRLPKIIENRSLGKKFAGPGMDQPVRGEVVVMRKDHNGNNRWKVPVGGSSETPSSRLVKGISWNDGQMKPQKLSSPELRIWNPADVHVKKEHVSDESGDEDQTTTTTTTTGVATNGRLLPQSAAANVVDEKVASCSSREDEEKDESSEEDEDGENIDVENVDKDAAMENSEDDDSDEELDDDMDFDGKGNKRTRKPDHPRKRLKAM